MRRRHDHHVHIVGLAMLTGRRVLSGDLRQRRLLWAITGPVPALNELYWASPVEEGVEDWLSSGLPLAPAFSLAGNAAGS